MKIYFDNDGSYGQSAVNIPVLVNDKVIGLVLEVTEERVTCLIWDRFVDRLQVSFNMSTTEQDIRAISIEV